MDVKQVARWVEDLGFETKSENATTLRLIRADYADLPPFFIQCTENWILLSILPVLPSGYPEGLFRRMLRVNREMRVAKFALGKEQEVILCAELPTESLDQSELADTVTRMVDYVKQHRGYLATGLPANS